MSGTRLPPLVLGLPTLDPDPSAVTPGSDLTIPCMALVLALLTRPDPPAPGLAT